MGLFLKLLFISLFVVVVIRNAWVSEDAYITFRTVDNFINGYGLTWNTTERVQNYTSPLWMFFSLVLYFFTHEMYYTSIIMSIATSTVAVALFAFKIARSTVLAILGITILTFSKAFIDYSTSGLENPLSHLILGIFLFVYLKSDISFRTLCILSLIAGIGALNRTDTFLLFVPVLAYVFFKLHKFRDLRAVLKGLSILAVGLAPFIVWESFSLFYYGSLLPNPAYGKVLNTGIDKYDMIEQGRYYLMHSITIDPLTVTIIVFGIIVPFLTKDWRNIPVVAGIISYLIYVIQIGGDFMDGRFLTLPFFSAVILLSRCRFTHTKSLQSLAFLSVLLVGFGSSYPPLLSDANYGLGRDTTAEFIHDRGIADERAYYYQGTGLLKPTSGLIHPWAAEGMAIQRNGPSVIVRTNVGFLGFYAGPKVHIIDPFGVTDPLLARLPAINKMNNDTYWRIGHFFRVIPQGYVETIDSGQNTIKDKDLAVYFDKLSYIIRGELFDTKRIMEIWNMNTGKYDHLLDAYVTKYSNMYQVNLSEIEKPKTEGTLWDQIDNAVFFKAGVQINLGNQYHVAHIEISLDNNDDYQIVYVNTGSEVASQIIPAHPIRSGLVVRIIDVPAEAVQRGYDSIRIFPLRGDGLYSIGHIKMLE